MVRPIDDHRFEWGPYALGPGLVGRKGRVRAARKTRTRKEKEQRPVGTASTADRTG